jgi:hypothetical protein
VTLSMLVLMSYVLRVAMGRSIKEKTSAPYVVIITSIAGILLYGCVNSGGGVSVDLKWLKHEAAFQKALKGARKMMKRQSALNYILIFTLGTLPTLESVQDLVRLRAWYKVNKQRLYWAEATQTVKVRPLES